MKVGYIQIPFSSLLFWKLYKKQVVQSSAALEDSMCVRMFFVALVAFLLPWVSVLVLHLYDLSQFLFALLLMLVFVCIDPLDDSSAHSCMIEDPSCIVCMLCLFISSLCATGRSYSLYSRMRYRN